MRKVATVCGVLLCASALCGSMVVAHAQWLNYPTPGTPRGKDGKPNLSAKAPRAANGKPDLSGVWQTEFESAAENARLFGPALTTFVVPGDDPSQFSRYFLNILSDFTPETSPIRPVAEEQTRKNREGRGTANPTEHCLPAGIPSADLFNYAPALPLNEGSAGG